MKVQQYLFREMRSWQGSVLGFGLSEDIKQQITENRQITSCNLLELIGTGKGSEKGSSKESVLIKKLRKRFSNNSHTYIMANYEVIAPFKKTFVRDSIRIASEEIYLYLPKNVEEHHIQKMYERYANVTVAKEADGIVLVVKTAEISTNWFLDQFYYVVDVVWDFFDFVSDLMIG